MDGATLTTTAAPAVAIDRRAILGDRRVVLALPLASAVLLWAAFPPTSIPWLAWVALVPLFLLVDSPARPRALFRGAWLGGFLFWMLAIEWIHIAEPGPESWFAVTLMAAVLGLWWPAGLLMARAGRRLGVPLWLALPLVWVAWEYARAYSLSGFPWYYLAHSQFRLVPMIQVADLAGAWGLSLVIALVNAVIADAILGGLDRRRPALAGPILAVLIVLGTLGYGVYRLQSAAFRDGPRLALVQSNIKQERKNNDPETVYFTYFRLVQQALAAGDRPDLIVWPETSYPYGYIVRDPALSDEDFASQARAIFEKNTVLNWTRKMDDIRNSLRTWVDKSGVPMMIGTTFYDHSVAGLSKFNSAVLIEPNRPDIQAYHKMHLVPFGEYVPLLETIPAITMLTPYRGDYIPTLNFGPGPSWMDWHGLKVAVAICFEDSVPQVTRRFFAPPADERPTDLLINQSNDGWFYGSPEHEMHLATSVFRAVEHRVPLVRAVNTGISALVDGDGRIRESLPATQEGILSVIVPLDDRSGPYSRGGDWLPQLCAALTLLFCLIGILRPTQIPSPNSPILPNGV